MRAIEFEVDIENGVIRIPEAYKHFRQVHAKVIVLTQEVVAEKVFDPRAFYGVVKTAKADIDEYLRESREGWQ